MCGRYVSVSSPTILADRFGVDEVRITEHEPSYNVAPRAEMPVIATSRGKRVLDKVRWGLVPSWAKDLSIGDRQINARAEAVAVKPAFKRAFLRRRAIVPADGFYEWQKVEGKVEGKKAKQPWFIRRRDGEPLALAGLWEIWHDPNVGDDAPRIRTFTIITADPNELVKPLHDRMPVVLPESEWDRWLDPEYQDVDALRQLLVPAPASELEAWPIGPLVNKADNDGPELLEHVQVSSA
jgi:putative SOS response-associated peptidase YedK